MAVVTVKHVKNEIFQVHTRGHSVTVDQPDATCGECGPTSVELFVAAMASCAAHYAVSYLREHDLPYERLELQCRWNMRAAPARVHRIELRVHTPVQLDTEQHDGLLEAITHCTVHNTLREPPRVDVVAVGPPRGVTERPH
jgi:uncharacterized OsmC-like protein